MKPLQASPATAGGGVLRHKHGMTPIRGLLAIIPGSRRRKALGQKSSGMLQYRVESPILQVGLLRSSEVEFPAKG